MCLHQGRYFVNFLLNAESTAFELIAFSDENYDHINNKEGEECIAQVLERIPSKFESLSGHNSFHLGSSRSIKLPYLGIQIYLYSVVVLSNFAADVHNKVIDTFKCLYNFVCDRLAVLDTERGYVGDHAVGFLSV